MSSQPPSSTANLFSTIPTLRPYRCYNCNNYFYITRVSTDDASSSSPPPTSFRCPICFHLHLIPFHTVVPPPPPTPTPLSPMANASSTSFSYTPNNQPPPPTPLSARFNSTPNNQQQGHRLDSRPEYEDFFQTRITRFLNSLPVKVLNSNTKSNQSTCSICMEEFGKNIVVELQCGHYFDKDCITELVNRRRTCPMCRSRLSLGDSAYNNEVGLGSLGRELELLSRFVREARGSRVVRRMNEAESSLNAEARRTDQRVLVLLTYGGGESSRSAEATTDDDN